MECASGILGADVYDTRGRRWRFFAERVGSGLDCEFCESHGGEDEADQTLGLP